MATRMKGPFLHITNEDGDQLNVGVDDAGNVIFQYRLAESAGLGDDVISEFIVKQSTAREAFKVVL